MNADKNRIINVIKNYLVDGCTIVPNDNYIMLSYFGEKVPSRIEEVYLDNDGIVCVIVRRLNDGEENCLDYDRLDNFSLNEVIIIFKVLQQNGLFKNINIMDVIDCKKSYTDINFEYLVKALYDRDETKLLDESGFDVQKLKNLFKPIYHWFAWGDWGEIEDCSKSEGFETEKECYEDMREKALKKMTWNTQYDEDFEEEGTEIGYDVWFRKDMIVHKSYSGVYVYKMYKGDNKPSIDEMETIMREYEKKFGC